MILEPMTVIATMLSCFFLSLEGCRHIFIEPTPRIHNQARSNKMDSSTDKDQVMGAMMEYVAGGDQDLIMFFCADILTKDCRGIEFHRVWDLPVEIQWPFWFEYFNCLLHEKPLPPLPGKIYENQDNDEPVEISEKPDAVGPSDERPEANSAAPHTKPVAFALDEHSSVQNNHDEPMKREREASTVVEPPSKRPSPEPALRNRSGGGAEKPAYTRLEGGKEPLEGVDPRILFANEETDIRSDAGGEDDDDEVPFSQDDDGGVPDLVRKQDIYDSSDSKNEDDDPPSGVRTMSTPLPTCHDDDPPSGSRTMSTSLPICQDIPLTTKSSDVKEEAATKRTTPIKPINPSPVTKPHTYTSAWKGREDELPPVDQMKYLLRVSKFKDKEWNPSNRWVRDTFRKLIDPDDVEKDDTGLFRFTKTFMGKAAQQEQLCKTQVRTVEGCAEIFRSRQWNKLGKVIQKHAEIIRTEQNEIQEALESFKRLQRKPFTVDAMEAVYKIIREPWRHDNILGGRDKGGVYTELTFPSALRVMETLKQFELLPPGALVMEMGCGLMTIGLHFALMYDVFVYGVEIQPERARYGINSVIAMKDAWNHKRLHALKTKPHYTKSDAEDVSEALRIQEQRTALEIQNFEGQLKKVHKRVRVALVDGTMVCFDNVTVLYCMDEAYNDHESWEIYDKWVLSKCKVLVCYKANKRGSILRDLIETYPQVKIRGKVKVRKVDGGGSSTAVILTKDEPTLERYESMPALDISQATPELQTKLYPFSSDGVSNDEWFDEYKKRVVDPLCSGAEVRPRRKRSDEYPCSAHHFIRCDPDAPGKDCKCDTFFRPLPSKATFARTSAIQGKGFFANVPIPENTLITYYKGTVSRVPPEDTTYVAARGSNYVDAKGQGKHQYINHSCDPNCILKTIFDDSDDFSGGLDLAIISNRVIKEKEELTIDYGVDEAIANFGVTVCLCKSPKCRYEANRLVLFCNQVSNDFLRLVEEDRAAEFLEGTRNKDWKLESQDARDHFRMLKLQALTQCNVYTVATDTKGKRYIDDLRHLDCNVNQSRQMTKGLKSFGVRYSAVYVDWMWTPNEWWREHVKASFFHETLPSLVVDGHIRVGSVVFLPFNPYVLHWLASPPPKAQKVVSTLMYNYMAELLTEEELEGHELWAVTQSCDRGKFYEAFEKDIDASTNAYIKYTKNECLQLLPDATHPNMMTLVDIIEDRYGMESIRFVRLTVRIGWKQRLFQDLVQA